ncbi:fluoride efflux transporter CrcB [Actinoplanes sp. TBRC 11911]|uniref:fluoride efflux transporter CrcB n=1 Tax=Actinoplanes sp. TBRC 11911 TaxID=2729386 RepID=UPI00145CB397|nr:fluoride efflux transporter CrcB [Actinoplanes sp. TBRC 11911]NMO54643.1 fluoride efflux transporter CrcB [Actinoplanes sp. TBRC 11911]
MLGAAVGAPVRYLADRAVQARHDSVFPWGTFTVNVAGSFIFGVLLHGVSVDAVPGSVNALLSTGLCGGLTTYSTFGYETIRLLEQRVRAYAVLNVAASVVAGLGAAFCGIAVAEAIWH